MVCNMGVLRILLQIECNENRFLIFAEIFLDGSGNGCVTNLQFAHELRNLFSCTEEQFTYQAIFGEPVPLDVISWPAKVTSVLSFIVGIHVGFAAKLALGGGIHICACEHVTAFAAHI